MSDLTVNLKHKIDYDYKGEKVEASFVSISPPTVKHIHLTSVLKQAFQVSAVKNNERNKDKYVEEKDDKNDSKTENSDAVAVIYAGGSDINIKEVMLTAKELMTSGLVLVEGEEKLTKPLCDKLDQEDFEEILGAFLVNFILASLLKNQKKS